MSIFNKINELIKNYELFLIDQPKGEFSDFGNWLSCKYAGYETEADSPLLTTEVSSHQGFYMHMPPERQFLTMLSRASRFIDFYIRKALEGTKIKSRLEFQFLISIKEMGIPRKTDVIYFNLTEISTGVETLKRLKSRGLIKDFADKSDKRISRLELTKAGAKVVAEALNKFNVLDKLTSTFGAEDDWKDFIPALMQFNEIHNNFYQANKQKTFKEFSNNIKNGNYES